MATKRKKRREWVPPLQRDPGPWTPALISWLAALGIIMVLGLVMLYSASYTTGYLRMGDSFHYMKTQMICMLLGLAAMILFAYMDHRFLRKWVVPLYFVGVILLVLVLFSEPLNGCRRWLRIGGLTVQVSDLMKFEMILLTAHIAASIKHAEPLDPKKKGLLPFSKNGVTVRAWLFQRIIRELVFPLAPLLPVVFLLSKEPHMSAIVLTCAIVGTILLLSGNGGIFTWIGAGTMALVLETALQHIDSIPYLKDRLDGWTQDLSQMTDQTLQSLYAIGSGGLTGLGLGNSVEKQLWLPESTNDFIFSVVCEELGFVGAVLIILLFVIFLVLGLQIAFNAENYYSTMVGIGIMAQIAWQVFCNIAVVTNTLPNTGISLPFFSSGGTSLILLMAEMGVMVNIGRNGARAQEERARARAEREARREAERQAHAPIVLEHARRLRMEQE